MPKIAKSKNQLVNRRSISLAAVAALVLVTVTAWVIIKLDSRTSTLVPGHASTLVPGQGSSPVPGQSYLVCANPGQFLTSPWTYHALASGSHSYTVAQYEALPGYGTTLPPLPAYISRQSSSTEAAVIFAPGASEISLPEFEFPPTPILYYFEGGAYTGLALDSVSGDEFIGGAAPGYPEPRFDDGTKAGGIGPGNTSDGYTGGSTKLAQAASNSTSIHTTGPLPAYTRYVTFSDGVTRQISTYSGTSITLDNPVTEPSGAHVWFSGEAPLAALSSAASKGAASVTLTSSSLPVIKWGNYVIGTDDYQVNSVSGSQSSYTIGLATSGLDAAAAAGTPVYYNTSAGGVTVSYLDIRHDIHQGLSGVITTGAGWTVTHNNIQDSYTAATAGTAEGNGIFGGDESTIEYNCLSRIGNNAMVGWYATNAKWDYNEVYQSAYQDDPGCGCTAAGKWWGTLNTDIVGNAFIDDGIGATGSGLDVPDIWFDNGNSGTNVSGNYFDKAYSSAVVDETGFNLNVTNNLFEDGGWASGSGCGDTNCVGAVELNTSGGFNVPGSRYNNQVNISGNQFVDNWGDVAIWESNLRNCESSGEGYPVDAPYCAGGFPTTATAAAGGHYYFSHETDSIRGGTGVLAQAVPAGSTTVTLQGDAQGTPAAAAINDQIGFANPVKTTSNDSSKSVTGFNGSGSSTLVVASASGFPASGQLRVGTSAAGSDGGGGYTGAILSYNGIRGNIFQNVSLVRGTGTIQRGYTVLQVQPYKVTAETCTANDCTLVVSPPLARSEAAGATVTSAGTCPLFATAAATPTGPLAPDGAGSYFDGCQWGVRNISVKGNRFTFDPAAIASGTTVTGHVGTTCTAAHANNCGTNFMAFQVGGGVAPWNYSISQNAMFSQSALTGCPSWDSGCTTNALANLNALSNPPNAPAHNNEAAWNDVWSDNIYAGPLAWNVYNYGGCYQLPSDSATGKSMPSNSCVAIDFASWQSDWEQDLNSIYNPTPPSASPAPSG